MKKLFVFLAAVMLIPSCAFAEVDAEKLYLNFSVDYGEVTLEEAYKIAQIIKRYCYPGGGFKWTANH